MNSARDFSLTKRMKEWILAPFAIAIFFLLLFISFRLGSAGVIQDTSLFQSDTPKFPQGYFVEPTDSSLKIAGNFGEIRPNHFHAGLDVKTAGREGLNIYAVADGYVSRIKISAFGYGKCVYITHPNGYVSVYGHLQRLSGKLAKYLKLEQYRLQSFEVDLYPDKNILPVKQCDTIAISGNTGGSQSPHLHFEIRDTKTEHAYNPFLFGYKIDDTVPPVISLLKVYAATDSSAVNGSNTAKKIAVFGRRGRYHLSPQTISVHGDIGFGIETTDYGNIKEAGKLGAYSIDLYIDGKRIYYHELNEIAFDESRYINAHIDYAESGKSGRQVQQCFRDKNNMLSIYECVVNEGLFRFDDNNSHDVKFIVKDFFQNASVLEFSVKASPPSPLLKERGDSRQAGGERWNCCDENKYETENVKIWVGPCGLYQDIDFKYSMSTEALPGTFSPIHTISDDEIPLHTPFSLSIKANNLPERLRSKATIVWLDGKNNKVDQKGGPTPALPFREGDSKKQVSPEGGDSRLPDGQVEEAIWVTAQPKSFGRFTVAVDTVAPTIKAHNIFNGKNMSRAKMIGVMIGDNLTGIKSYRATIDGKWVLMEYEYKKALLFYEFDEQVGEGRHLFRLEVKDAKENLRVYTAEFIR